jgi:hypothetical protein
MQKNKNDPVTTMVETQSTNKDNNVEKWIKVKKYITK